MRGLMIGERKDQLSVDTLRRTMIPKRLWNVSIDLIGDEHSHKKELQKYFGGLLERLRDGVGLWLSGAHGSGKTSAAVAMAIEVLYNRGTVLFLEGYDLKKVMINDPAFDDEESWIERLETVNLLIVDDPEGMGKSEYAGLSLNHIVRKGSTSVCRRSSRPTSPSSGSRRMSEPGSTI